MFKSSDIEVITDIICKNYTCDACVNGSCPIANSESYEECGIPLVHFCNECSYYKGCEECYWDGEKECGR